MNILLAFPNRDLNTKLKRVLVSNGFDVRASCTTGIQTLEATDRMEECVIVCGVRFSDMMYHELKDNLTEASEMIVIASIGQWDQYGADDVTFLETPFKVYDLLHTVESVSSRLERRLYAKKHAPKKRSSREQAIINEAKKMLMELEGYTEEGAHRYIQKESMDHGSSMVHMAEEILSYIKKREGLA